MAPYDLSVTRLAAFDSTFGEAGSESVAFAVGRYFVTNGAANRVDVFTVADGRIGGFEMAGLPNYGGVTSVAAKNGVVAVAYAAADTQEGASQPGRVVLFDAETLVQTALFEVGFLPDHVSFSADGALVFTANEGEPNDAGDAPGSLSVIDVAKGEVATYGFDAFAGQEDALRAAGVRIFPGKSVTTDLEPEYIAQDPVSGDLLVTLQEANAVAVFDLETRSFTAIRPLGTVDHSVDGSGIDASDRDGAGGAGAINIATRPVQGLRMPDALATFEVGGRTYVVTANEGDARDEEARVNSLTLDPTVFPNAALLKNNANLGRLTVSNIDGDTDNDGFYDALFSYGSRSFTIFDDAGAVVFDSGDQFEQIIARLKPDLFNAENGDVGEFDKRSDNKGPEPEGVAVIEAGGRKLAVIGLERDGGLMVFDVTDPAGAFFVDYIDSVAEGDFGPEVVVALPEGVAQDGGAAFAVAYEISGTTAVYEVSVAFPEDVFTLELLHLADQEASTSAIENAPNLSAVLNALRAQDLGGDDLADNTLTLSSGDAFIPSVFFNASGPVFGSAGIADILIQNELGIEAIAFGNHEFDFGPAVLAGLISGAAAGVDQNGADFAGTAFPYLSSNLNFATNANLAPLAVEGGLANDGSLAGKVTSSVVQEVGGELIGVVGATTPTLGRISSPGTVGISPVWAGVTPTAAELDALAAVIQAEVDGLLADNPTMNKVILLAHMQQISIELALAERLVNVDVIVAGGSNTRLFDENDRVRDGDSNQGAYPQFVTNAGGTTTAVVNTDGSYKYVGRLVIDFDADGNILEDSYDAEVSGAYATDDAGVAALEAGALVDPEIQAIVDLIEARIVATEANVFGLSDVFLNGNRSGSGTDGVRTQETNLGNLTADANLAAARAVDPTVMVSIKNGGGIRASIGETVVPPGGSSFVRQPNGEILDSTGAVIKPEGGVSQNDIATALAFNNGLSLLTVTRAQLLATLEHAVAGSTPTNAPGQFAQVSGVDYSYDLSRPAGERILSAAILNDAGLPVDVLARGGELVGDADATVRIVTLNFMAAGGDGYPFPSFGDVDRLDLYDLDRDGMADAGRTGVATFADNGSEQDALAEHLAAEYAATPYAEADVGAAGDTRIQNVAARADTVLALRPEVVINEILASTTGTDVEFIELYGDAGFSLAGLSLIGVESDAGGSGATAPGRIDFRLDFGADATLGQNGFFLVGTTSVQGVYGVTPDVVIGTNALENSSATYALVQTASLSGVAVAGAEVVLDSVMLKDTGAADLPFFDAPVVGPDGSNLPAGARRLVDGIDTDTAADWALGDFNLNSASAPNTPTAATRAPVAPTFTLISAVQGAGDASGLAGQTVTVEAIVVGDFQNGDGDATRNLGGFYLQEEDADADASALTSEGVFVFDGTFGVDVKLGDKVRVTATVGEFFGLTQLQTVTAVEVVSSGAAAPTAAVVDLPAAGTSLSQSGAFQADLEAYEGMLVTFQDRLTVSEMFNLDRFNEVRLVAGDRAQSFTQDNAPDVAGFAAHLNDLGARTIVYDDGLNVQNADIDLLDGFAPFDTASAVRMGDTVDGLTGVLDYQWAGNASSGATWRVRSVEDGSNSFADGANAREATPEDVGGRLKVASFNVLNYFATIDVTGVSTAIGQDPRGADSVDEFARQTDKLVTTILAMDADVIGLVELENDFDALSSGNAVAALVDALNADLGVEAWAWVDPGRQFVGTDAISAGFIYDTRTVGLAGSAAILDTTAFVDPMDAGSQQNRPAVAQTFVELATGAKFTAVSNHLKSKGSSTGAAEDADQNDGQGFSNATRAAAAAELARWLATDPTGQGDADVLVMGDLNAYAKEDPIAALEAAGYVNLGAQFEGEGNYSYVFDGQTGTLDYVLANAALAGQVTGATEWRINSDEADALDYNLDFGRDAAMFDGATPFRSSDHDPVIVGLDLDLNLVAGVAGNDRLVGTAAADRIEGRGGNDLLSGLGGADVFVFGAELSNGRRETVQIRDYEAGVDVIDLGGAEILGFRELASAVQLTLADDRDVVMVRGVSDFDQIVFADDLLVA